MAESSEIRESAAVEQSKSAETWRAGPEEEEEAGDWSGERDIVDWRDQRRGKAGGGDGIEEEEEGDGGGIFVRDDHGFMGLDGT